SSQKLRYLSIRSICSLLQVRSLLAHTACTVIRRTFLRDSKHAIVYAESVNKPARCLGAPQTATFNRFVGTKHKDCLRPSRGEESNDSVFSVPRRCEPPLDISPATTVNRLAARSARNSRPR